MAADRPPDPEDPIGALAGAGPKTAAKLAGAGLARVRDLLCFLPRSYEDYRRVYRLAELAGCPPGTPVVVRARVVRVHPFFRRLLDVIVEQDGVRLRARWFRPRAGMAKAYVKGSEVALAGRLRKDDGQAELIHPSNVTSELAADAELGLRIRPRYASIPDVPGRTVEKIVASALGAAASLPEILPAELRSRYGLPGIAEALRYLHRPPAELTEEAFAALAAGRSPAHRRLAFEQGFLLQLGLALERARTRVLVGWSCGASAGDDLAAVARALPFTLTGGQTRAIRRIFDGLRGPAPMQCLLQGDVGSGKTAVAFAAAVRVWHAGGQSLMMAPTAVLAEQHHRTLSEWGSRIGLRVGLLHGGLEDVERAAMLSALRSGGADLIVGTHALLEAGVEPRRFALAIVDEQHRFGVRQRFLLRRPSTRENDWQSGVQSGMVPHLLVLSATPIPRTLALTLYGDLDLVTLDELPPGREPVRTAVARTPEERSAAYRAALAAVNQGEQVFAICPAIDDEGSARVSTSSLAKELRQSMPRARVAVVHGQLAPESQRRALERFRRGLLDVLVATTVLEVGVDVPNASVIVVEDADRFGLAQLHQLRGRVGRGRAAGRCFLITRSTNPEALSRLAVLATVHDGFRLAEEDLRMRGPGDLWGTRQAGSSLGLATLADDLDRARQAADDVLSADPQLSAAANRPLAEAVARQMAQGRPIAEEAG